MPAKLFNIETHADTPAGPPDEIAGVPERVDRPSDVDWEKPGVPITMSKPFQSLTIKSELASCKQLPDMCFKPDVAPDVPIRIILQTP